MSRAPFLRIRGVSKSFRARRRWRNGWWTRESPQIAVLRSIDLDLERGRTLALVGPSGSGKTTLARCLARFEMPDSGEIALGGSALATIPRGRIQLIFQQPAASLSPRFTAEEIVSEPLVIRKWGTKLSRRAKATELMETVGLVPADSGKRSVEFSGGECQRLAIARALALEPGLLILDESFSSLDLSLQAQIANLLLALQAAHDLTYILISHDLSLVGRLADEIAVIDHGTIVERGPAATVMADPRYPVTRELVEANRLLGLRIGL
jgi:ABC-type glutathione transport system ATPase component